MQALVSRIFTFYSGNIGKIIYYTCMIILAIVFTERLFIIFSYEAHIAGIDNNFDYPVIRSLAGFSMYPNPEDYPYAVNPYAPLFFIVCKWAASLMGISATDTIEIYWTSRAICLLADVGTCILLFRMLRKYVKASPAISIICTALFFGIVSFLGYTINRSDSFFLFFYCSTLYVLMGSKSNQMWTAMLAAVLTTACVFSKQNGIVLLALVPVWFIVARKYKSVLFFLLFSSIFCAASLSYFQYSFTDQFFTRHIIDALKNKIDPRWFYIYIFKQIAPSYLTLFLGIAAIVSVKAIAVDKQQLLKRLGVLYLLQLLFSTALSFKWGSSLGYYNEAFLIGFILIALYSTSLADNTRQTSGRIASIYGYPALLIFFVHMTAQSFFFFINSKEEAKEKFNEQKQISQYIKKGIGETNKHVIDLSNADLNFFKNMLFKECAAPNIDAVNCCTLPDKIFDYSGLLKGLQNGKILFIIKEKDAAINSVWGVDLHHYKKDTIFKNYSVYKYDSLLIKSSFISNNF